MAINRIQLSDKRSCLHMTHNQCDGTSYQCLAPGTWYQIAAEQCQALSSRYLIPATIYLGPASTIIHI